MQSHFTFDSAVAAAQISPEAFAAEFAKPDANANIKQSGEPLICDLIADRLELKIPDDKLPPLLTILIAHGVDIESENNHFKERPLAIAASHRKEQTVNFLIAQGALINGNMQSPALCAMVDSLLHSPSLTMVKNIIENHGADIDIQDCYGYTALTTAVKNPYANKSIIPYLISKGANLFLRVKLDVDEKTALSFAYGEYYRALGYHNSWVSDCKDSLNLLVKAAYEHFYQKASSYKEKNQTFASFYQELLMTLYQDLEALAGNFQDYKQDCNSTNLKKLLEKEALKPALKEFLIRYDIRSLARSQHFKFFDHPLMDINAIETVFALAHEMTASTFKPAL